MIRSLVDGGVLKNSIPNFYIHDQNGQQYTEYLSDKRDSLVIVARLSPEFTAVIVDRWQELEQQAQPKIPQSFAEALQLAANQALQIEQDAPKVKFYDTVAERENLMTVTQVASKLGMSAQALNKRLTTLGAYDARIKRCKTFASDFIAKGYGKMRVGSTGHDQGLITQSGQAWIVGLFGEPQ